MVLTTFLTIKAPGPFNHTSFKSCGRGSEVFTYKAYLLIHRSKVIFSPPISASIYPSPDWTQELEYPCDSDNYGYPTFSFFGAKSLILRVGTSLAQKYYDKIIIPSEATYSIYTDNFLRLDDHSDSELNDVIDSKCSGRDTVRIQLSL